MEETVTPWKISLNISCPERINLLELDDGDQQHYVYISNFSRLMHTKENSQRYYCFNCLTPFTSDEKRSRHQLDCQIHAPQRVRYPEGEKAKLKFYNYKHTLQYPFTIFCDSEAMLEPVRETSGSTVKYF